MPGLSDPNRPPPQLVSLTPQLVSLTPPLLEVCVQLDREALGGLWTPSQWRQELADGHRPGLGLQQGNALLAAACGWRVLDELHVTLVAVTPASRRQGLGRRVLGALLSHARGRGASRATLEVEAGNTAALGLYRSLGFTTQGRRRDYYRDGGDALIQWADLRTPAIDAPSGLEGTTTGECG